MALRLILAGALVFIPATTRADDVTTYSALTGRCTAVVTMDVVTDPTRCAKQVVNIEYPSGRTGFMFVLNQRGDATPTVFSFLGDGARQLHPNGDTAIQPIDHVYVTSEGWLVSDHQSTSAHAGAGLVFGGQRPRQICGRIHRRRNGTGHQPVAVAPDVSLVVGVPIRLPSRAAPPPLVAADGSCAR